MSPSTRSLFVSRRPHETEKATLQIVVGSGTSREAESGGRARQGRAVLAHPPRRRPVSGTGDGRAKMSLTTDQRVEKIASRLFVELSRVAELNDGVRDLVYTRTIEKLEANGMSITAEDVRTLRTVSLDIG